MKKILRLIIASIIALGFTSLSFHGYGQTTTTSFTTYNTNPAGGIYDFSYSPFRAQSTWQGDCAGCSPLPTTVQQVPRDRYYRFVVTDILDVNSVSDQYNWTNSNSGDNCFDCEFNSAIDHGGTMAIEIHFQCSYCSGHGPNIADPAQGGRLGYLIYPKSWHNAFQLDAVKDFTWSEGGFIQWSPNLNSATFQAKWKSLHTNIANHLLTTSHVSAKTGLRVFYWQILRYVVVSGYGEVGEWTNTPYQPNGIWPGPSGSAPTDAALDSMIASVCEAYPNNYVINQIATFDGNQLSGNTHISAAVGWYALEVAKTKKGPLGIRNDGIGNGSNYILNWTVNNPTTFVVPVGYPGAGGTFHFDTAIQNRYKYAPIVGEPCCPNFLHGSGNSDVLYSTQPSLVQLMHFGEFNNGNNWDGGTPGNPTFQQNWRISASLSGYKMVLTQVVSTTSIVSGTTFNITPTWNNLGVAPPYMGWTVVWELKTAPGQPPVWTDSSTFNMLGFLPGTPTAFSQNYTKAIPAGTYGFYVTVKDPQRYYDPMPLYVTTTQNTDGSYFIRNVTVSASGVPVANAGPDQAITLPTSSVTLDGSGTSGTVTTYTWSQLSGPNTATLATPSTVTCVASGMIQGTYTFKLAVTTGTSTSTTNVTVNPSVPPSSHVFSTQTPVATVDNDNPPQCCNTSGGEEVGMRFKSTISGYVTGVRFYKQVGNAGTHIGELYTNTGTRLAQATFTNETASGWQYVNFATPIAITANTVYVIAYWSSLGNYTEDNQVFNGTAITNTNLIAPTDGLNGGDANPDLTNTTNAPWAYAASPTFPNNAYHAANYWVDVNFSITLPTGCFCLPRNSWSDPLLIPVK